MKSIKHEIKHKWFRFIWTLPPCIHNLVDALFGKRVLRMQSLDGSEIVKYMWITEEAYDTFVNMYREEKSL